MYLPLSYGQSGDLCVRIDASSHFGDDSKVYCELHVGPMDEFGKLRTGHKRGAVLQPHSSAQLRGLEFSLPRDVRPWKRWRVQLKVWACTCLPFGFSLHHGSFIGKTMPLELPFRTQSTPLWLDKRRGGTVTHFSVTWSAQRCYSNSSDILNAAKLLSRDMVEASVTWDDKRMAQFFMLISDGWDGCEEKCLELILHAYKPTSILYEAVRRKKLEAVRILVSLGAPLHQLHVEECKSPYTLAKDLECTDVLLNGKLDNMDAYSYKQLMQNNYWDVVLYRIRKEQPESWVSRVVFTFAWSHRWPKVALEVVNNSVNSAFSASDDVTQCFQESDEWHAVGNALLKKGAINANVVKSVFTVQSKSTEAVEIVIDGLRKMEVLPKVLLFQRCTECLICFEPTYANIPSYFTDLNGKRTCVHYLCHACAVMVSSTGECPVCRVPIACVVAVPSIKEEPQAWFKTVDAHCNDYLTKLEVLAALEACLPLDKQKLAEAMNELWESWAGKQNVISADDFFKSDGLFQFVLLHEEQLMRDLEIGCFGEDCVLPAISSPAKWFDVWSNGGHLKEFDMLRGLLKTLKISSLEREKMYDIQRTLREALEAFGALEGLVDKEEFIKPGGLGELLMDSFFPSEQPVLSSQISSSLTKMQSQISPVEDAGRACSDEVKFTKWHINLGKWRPVSEFLQNLLEASLKRGSSSVKFHLGGCDYEVTFITETEGTQVNLSTGTLRPMQRKKISNGEADVYDAQDT